MLALTVCPRCLYAKMFARDEGVPKPKPKPSEQKQQKQELLNGRRANNMAVVLKQIKIEHVDLCNIILSSDAGSLDADSLEGLLRILPEREEVSVVST